MTVAFELAIADELFDGRGAPLFGSEVLAGLARVPGLRITRLDDSALRPDHARAFDAIYLNALPVSHDLPAAHGLRLGMIARHGAGFDALDIPALSAAGIVVTNTPGVVNRPVAAMVMTFALALGQKLLVKDNLTRSGRWGERTSHMGLGLTGKTLGIIGAGGIGWETARLAAAFDMRLLVARSVRNQETQPRHGAQFAPLETVLAQADFLALTCRLSEETRHLIDAARLSKMKPTAFLINVARGAVADERALIAALQQGIIAGAGLDVFEQEPVDPGNPLLAMDNVILTPHALGWTDESFSAIGQTAAADILAFAGHCVPAHVVNPEALSHPRLAAWLGNGRDEPVARRAPFQLMP